jgi:DNA-binding NarL/FixJ family response regulator
MVSICDTSETGGVEVLIVDDQSPFRSVAGQLVSLIGWHLVGEAESGEAALVAARELRPELVLMDINLPGISGIEATRAIMAELPDTRVVLLSTYAESDLPADARECGAIAYVHKEDLTPRVLRSLLVG